MEKKKNVPVLRFPEFSGDWGKNKLEELCVSIVSGRTKPEIDGEFPVYGSTGIIGKSSNYTHDGKNLLIARVGANAGRINVANGKFSVTDNTLIVNVNENENIDFIYYYILVYDLNRLVFGSGQPLITGSQLKALKIRKPQQKEQQQLVSFLNIIDGKLQALKKKKDLLEQYKKGVLQKIFSQELRFKDHNGAAFPNWEKVKLGNYLTKFEDKTTINNQYPVLTSSRRGLFFQKDYFDGNDIASKDNTGYNIVPRNYFTYRHMSDDTIFKININKICERGIVSTLYPVFTTKNINDEFLLLKINEGSEFKKYASEQKQGGSRTYMYFNKLELLVLNLPCIEEQTQIANFLTAIDDKINLCNTQIEKTEQWKKGLLQKMFV